MKMQMIAVEGPSFAGKTSVLNLIAKAEVAQVIPELSHFHDGGTNFPTEEYNQLSRAQVDDWFLIAEMRRTAYAKAASAKTVGHLIFLDRSYLSLAIHSTVTSLLKNEKRAPDFLEKLRSKFNEGHLLCPRLIYLKLDLGEHDRRFQAYNERLSKNRNMESFDRFRIDRYDRQRTELEIFCYNKLFDSTDESVVDSTQNPNDVHRDLLRKLRSPNALENDANRLIDELQSLF